MEQQSTGCLNTIVVLFLLRVAGNSFWRGDIVTGVIAVCIIVAAFARDAKHL
jgi:hypothetical protein